MHTLKLSQMKLLSKRERAALAVASAAPPILDPNPPTQATSAPGSISDSQIQHDILSWLRNPARSQSHSNQISKKLSTALQSHKRAVNAQQWAKTHWSNN